MVVWCKTGLAAGGVLIASLQSNSSYNVSHCFQEEVDGADDDADDMPEVQETVSVVPGSTLLWRIDSRPPHSATVWNHKLHVRHEM